jgi:hypothetical protein
MHVDNLWLSTLRYSSGWVLVSIVDLYGAILPLQGPYYVNPVLFLIVALIGTFILACVVVNSKRVFRKNTEMTILGIISLIYIIFLWGWNYHDYLQIGQAAGINGRYLVPVLILLYTLLGFGLRSALKPQNQYTTAIKVSLATIIIFSFVCLGGFSQYVYRISPIYGHIGHNNDFSEINSVNSVLVLNNQEKQVHISRHS